MRVTPGSFNARLLTKRNAHNLIVLDRLIVTPIRAPVRDVEDTIINNLVSIN